MITIELLTKEPFYLLHDTNSISIGKRARKIRKETKEEMIEYYTSQFSAEHSSMEWLHFRIVDDNCRGDIASHIVRATKGHPRFVVQSSRPDWNEGKERKPLNETYVKFASLWTPYSFIQMCRQRLCTRASKIDRLWVKDIIKLMKESDDPFFNALVNCCAPNCLYRGGCPEIKSCGFYTRYWNI